MAAIRELIEFTREALSAGRSREEIASALARAGWSRRDIDNALAAFADGPFLPPVPRPRRYLASRDAFLYALMFLALGLTAGHLISLLFAMIDLRVPQYGQTYYRVLAVEGQIRWALSVLVLAMPLFLWLMRLSERHAEGGSALGRSALRKWLTYLALLISALTFLGDAAYVIYRLLNGDATQEFLLKSLSVGVVAASIFTYYLRDAEWGQGRVSVRWFGASVAGVVVLAMVGGFWSVGGLEQAQRDQHDTLRYYGLTRISSVLNCNTRSSHTPAPGLPAVLTIEALLEYCPGHTRLPTNALLDPVTGEPFTYRRIASNEFQLCAQFSNPQRAYSRFYWSFPFSASTGCLRGQGG
ncbi:DUF5671 domain-containing protein [Nioella aestuarii]|uniref:DUF5671 domain-containing protein n=1 Tax=Nioella aestuarii TaxID=1662864 RepID=UPI003D7FBF43